VAFASSRVSDAATMGARSAPGVRGCMVVAGWQNCPHIHSGEGSKPKAGVHASLLRTGWAAAVLNRGKSTLPVLAHRPQLWATMPVAGAANPACLIQPNPASTQAPVSKSGSSCKGVPHCCRTSCSSWRRPLRLSLLARRRSSSSSSSLFASCSVSANGLGCADCCSGASAALVCVDALTLPAPPPGASEGVGVDAPGSAAPLSLAGEA
jgi:hypothetical protein